MGLPTRATNHPERGARAPYARSTRRWRQSRFLPFPLWSPNKQDSMQMNRPSRLLTLILVGLTLVAACRDAVGGYVTTVVMSGLDNPRGLAFGPDGSLYVVEAGRGGPGPSIVLGDGATNFLGDTGAVSRLRGGVQERVMTGLASLAPAGGARATGLHDIAFNASGVAYGLVGFGGDPALRATLGTPGAAFGQLVRLPLDGSPPVPVVGVAAHEATNPDGTDINSNPYGFAHKPGGGFVVADAGANAILDITAGGVVSTLVVLPSRPNPLPFGPPFFSAVPTTVAIGADGAYYVGELTGFPFPPGAANVYRVDPVTGVRTVAFSGFTNIIDFTFGPSGELYVLQFSSNGLTSPLGPGPGALFRIDTLTGQRSTISVDGLNAPSGVVVGPDGSLYVTNRGTSPGGGQVLRITAAPEPSTCILGGIGLVGLVGHARRRNWSGRDLEGGMFSSEHPA